MIVYILLTVATVALSFFVTNRYTKYKYGYSREHALSVVCLVAIFLMLFAVSALRQNVGNDYAKYCEFFHLIRCSLDTKVTVPTECGFNAVCLAIYFLCGQREIFPVMFAVFAFLTVFLFLHAIYRQADSFPATFFLFMTLGLYFQSLSTVRYYFALAIAISLIPYVLNREWIKFVLLTLLGMTFHKSIILIIPLYFLAQWSWKKYQYVLMAGFISTFFLFKAQYLSLFLKVYSTYEETEYLSGGTSMINILRCIGVLVLSLLLYEKAVKGNRKMSFYFYCNVGALVLYTCCSFLPVISRIGYYLSVTQIFFIPALVMSIENKFLKRASTILIALAGIGYFIIFLKYKAPADGLRILPYQTIIYHDMVTILSDMI